MWRQGNFDIAPSSPFWRHRPRGYLTKDSVYWFFRRWRHRNFDIDPLNRKGLSNARRLEVHWTFLYSRQVIYIRVSWSRSEFYSRRHVSEFLLNRVFLRISELYSTPLLYPECSKPRIWISLKPWVFHCILYCIPRLSCTRNAPYCSISSRQKQRNPKQCKLYIMKLESDLNHVPTRRLLRHTNKSVQ